jgi:thioredoxin reductase
VEVATTFVSSAPTCSARNVASVVHRGDGFRRGARRNIDAVARLVAKGKLRLLLGAEVRQVRAASLEIEMLGALRWLPFEALFVHLGAVPATGLLERAGVAIRREGE